MKQKSSLLALALSSSLGCAAAHSINPDLDPPPDEIANENLRDVCIYPEFRASCSAYGAEVVASSRNRIFAGPLSIFAASQGGYVLSGSGYSYSYSQAYFLNDAFEGREDETTYANSLAISPSGAIWVSQEEERFVDESLNWDRNARYLNHLAVQHSESGVIARLEDPFANEGAGMTVNRVVFSPDGQTIYALRTFSSWGSDANRIVPSYIDVLSLRDNQRTRVRVDSSLLESLLHLRATNDDALIGIQSQHDEQGVMHGTIVRLKIDLAEAAVSIRSKNLEDYESTSDEDNGEESAELNWGRSETVLDVTLSPDQTEYAFALQSGLIRRVNAYTLEAIGPSIQAGYRTAHPISYMSSTQSPLIYTDGGDALIHVHRDGHSIAITQLGTECREAVMATRPIADLATIFPTRDENTPAQDDWWGRSQDVAAMAFAWNEDELIVVTSHGVAKLSCP